MDELLEHLSQTNLPLLYRNVATQRIEYDEQIRGTYIFIRRALLDGADQLEITKSGFRWSKSGEILGQQKFPHIEGLNFAARMRKIIDVDSVVRKNVKIEVVNNNYVIIEFI